MIAWDKTAAQEMALPDDIWLNGDSERVLTRMEEQATRQRRIDLSEYRHTRAVTATAATDTEQIGQDKRKEAAGPVSDPIVRPSTRWLARITIGHTGGMVAAGSGLLTAATFGGSTPANLLEILIGVMALRIVMVLISMSSISHEQSLIRLSATRMWRDEALFGLVFCAAAFLLDWQLTPAFAGIFLALNFAFQFAIHAAGKGMLRRTSVDVRATRECRALIVGTGVRAKRVVDALLDHPELDLAPCGFLDSERTGLWRYRDVPLLGAPADFELLVLSGQVDALFVTTEPHEASISPQLLELARKMGVTVHVVPGNAGPLSILEIAHLNGFPTLVYRATPYRYTAMAFKRVADIIGGIILVILSSPVMAAAAIAVKAGSRGPVLFKQIRSGRNGRRFMLYKFRTMSCDAEQKKASLWKRNEMSGPVFKIKDDPRVTRIGKYLRKYSVDELPQLFNVLAGDMSLVGPRPPLPSEVLGYEPWQRRKLSVRPGLTCLWQVNGRNAIDFSDWMRLDLEYIDSWSLTLDMKILARTIPTVLKGSGV